MRRKEREIKQSMYNVQKEMYKKFFKKFSGSIFFCFLKAKIFFGFFS